MDFSHILTDPYTIVLAGLMVVCLAFLSFYYGLFYLRVGRYKGPKKKKKQAPAPVTPPVSVILTAQNDAEWLRNNLVYLLEQDYPDFEVVVVNYMSNDDTQFVLKVLTDNYSQLKVVPLNENANGYLGKKYPMSMGITSAKNEYLLLADPECMPKDKTDFSWIRKMMSGYVAKDDQMVLGFCGIHHKKGLFNLLQQYDNLDYSTEYLGMALMGHPFTGNGRNLSYRRSFFMKKHGFIYHYRIPDGADDMFVNQNASRKNTRIMLDDGAFTMVEPQPSMHQWHNYRKHRVATHRYYTTGLKLARLLRPICVVLFYALAALLFVMGTVPWQILAGVVFLKLAWQIITVSASTAKLSMKPVVFWLSPLLEIYFLFANTILAISPLPKK